MDKGYKEASANHGCVKTKAGGMTIDEPYGRDNSDYTGSAKQERAGALAGGKTDLSHSLEGSSANQGGK